MLRRKAHRLTTTLFVVVALLFSQLALASYICPEPTKTFTMDAAPGEPCEGMGMAADGGMVMDLEQPVLCLQHCANAPQSFDPPQVPAVNLPAIVQELVVPQLLDAGLGASAVYAEAGRTRPPPDPLFLSTLRLRV